MRIWLNGALQDGEATVSPLDHGLTTGDGVFETIKIVDGRPFAVTRHLERLVRSAVGLGLPEPDVAQLEEGVAAIVRAIPTSHSAGCGSPYTGGVSPLSSDRGTSGPTILIATQAIKRPGPTPAVVTVPWVRNETQCGRRPEDDVVRRERRRARLRRRNAAAARRSSRTRSATSARARVRTSSVCTTASSSRRPWNRGPWPA